MARLSVPSLAQGKALCEKHGLDASRVLIDNMDDTGYYDIRYTHGLRVVKHMPWPSDEAREDFRPFWGTP